MARPRKNDEANETVFEAKPIEASSSVETNVHSAPTVKLERNSPSMSGVSYRFPRIIGGVCESCGIIDRNLASELQYTKCKHYKDLYDTQGQFRCSYCDETVDPVAVVKAHTLNVATHPDDPSRLVLWCGSYKCLQKHEKRFKRGGN